MLKSFDVVILLVRIGLFGCGQQTPVPPAASTDHSTTGEQATLPDSHAGHSHNGAPSKSDHGSHGGHENMPMNMAPPRTLVVMSEPSQPAAGSTTKLMLKIQDADGTPIKSFDILHEQLVHLIVVRDGLDEFAHLHPDVDSSGMMTTQFVFPKSGKYRLFANHQPQGKPAGLATGEVNVSGSDAKTAPDGAVAFAAHFPKPGIYKAWGQCQRNGTVFTVPYVLEHKADTTSKDEVTQ